MKRENIFTLITVFAAFIFITFTGVIFHQSIFRMLPLYVSLAVSAMQSRVNRYASLVGGVNSIIYAAVYMHYNLYASAMYAMLMSFPLQIVTFVLWSKQPWKQSTMLKKLTCKMRAAVVAGAIAAWVLVCVFLSGTTSSYRELDTAVTVTGIVATVLTMLSYCEYTAAMVVSGMLSIILYLFMIKDSPEQITFLGYSVYSLVCSVTAFIRVRKIYDEQQTDKIKSEERCLKNT